MTLNEYKQLRKNATDLASTILSYGSQKNYYLGAVKKLGLLNGEEILIYDAGEEDFILDFTIHEHTIHGKRLIDAFYATIEPLPEIQEVILDNLLEAHASFFEVVSINAENHIVVVQDILSENKKEYSIFDIGLSFTISKGFLLFARLFQAQDIFISTGALLFFDAKYKSQLLSKISMQRFLKRQGFKSADLALLLFHENRACGTQKEFFDVNKNDDKKSKSVTKKDNQAGLAEESILHFQLKIVLDRTKPTIWRRLLVSEDLLLYDLHLALQIAMGWENCHLFEFTFGKYRIGLVDDSFAHLGYGKDELLDAEEISLGKILSKKGDKLNYTYDFGDDWKHTITVEKVIKSDDFLQTPICLGGERNCPPEDCGGVYGFYEMLEILKNKKHPDYKEMIEFLGDFDPDDFDKDEVNSFFENFWLNDEDDELAF